MIGEGLYATRHGASQLTLRDKGSLIKAAISARQHLVTSYDEKTAMASVAEKMEGLKQSLPEIDVVLTVDLYEKLHDREIRIDNGWVFKIGRGLDFYQKPDGWFTVGANDFS